MVKIAEKIDQCIVVLRANGAVKMPQRGGRPFGAGGDEGGARSAEWIEDDAVRLAECANAWFYRLRWLLRRVKPVLRVGKIHDIRKRISGRDGIALGEEIGIQLFLPNSWEISAEGQAAGKPWHAWD